MESQPLISVVIPAHNEERGIQRMLDSLIAQTYPNMQILLVDDGSTDQTLELAREYAERDTRITVLPQPCAGVSAARNRALPLCEGKYIRFVDADDTLPPDSMEKLVNRAERDQADLVIAGYTEYVRNLVRYKNLEDREDTLSCHEMLKLLNPHANSYFYGVLWNKLFLREPVQAGGIRFEERLHWGEDFVFVVNYLQTAETVAFMKDAVYDYRRTRNSATIRQVVDSVAHPMKNIRIKRMLYANLKKLYVARGEYPAYRSSLWLYLFRFGLDL